MVRDADHADGHAVALKPRLVLVIEAVEDPGAEQDAQRLLGQERVVAVHRVVVPRCAEHRARVLGVVLCRPVDERMAVPGRRLDVKEVTAVEDRSGVDLTGEVTNLPEFVEHGVGPVVGTAGRCSVGQVNVCAPDEVDAHGASSPMIMGPTSSSGGRSAPSQPSTSRRICSVVLTGWRAFHAL